MNEIMVWKNRSIFIILISLLILTIASNADAFIRREYTLEEIVHACSNVVFGKVTRIDPEKIGFVVGQIENIRGISIFKQGKCLLHRRKNRRNYLELSNRKTDLFIAGDCRWQDVYRSGSEISALPREEVKRGA